jgi:beta-glucosidase
LGNPAARAVELKKAVDAARSADVAAVFVGTDHNVEMEGRDRKTLRLTGNQEELIKAVVEVNPRTVVFFMNAGPVSSPWVDANVPAVLQGFWQGDMGGLAIAEILFGRSNPAARLPCTIYASDEQVPPQDVYDISKGYTYMFVKRKPLYPFGHGLSYTDFEYSNLRLSDRTVTQQGSVEVRVDVKNTGKMAGDEVVQVYFHDLEASVLRASRKLCAFRRISLKPGETQTIRFELPAETFAFYHVAQDRFVVEPGVIEIMVGASSEDIRLRGEVNVGDVAVQESQEKST